MKRFAARRQGGDDNFNDGGDAEGGRIYFGYLVVAAMVLTSFIPLSLGLSCAGIFYPALSDYLGVERGMLSYYMSVLWISSLVALPFLGKLLNDRDARLCLTGAVAVMAAGFVWLSFTRALWQFYLGAVAMGVGVAMLVFLAPSTLINRWFAKRAGFLIGVVMAFTGVGGVVWSTVGGILIGAIGWSATYLVFAVLAACAIPATLFMVRSRPSDKGLVPYGAKLGEGDRDGREETARQGGAAGSAAVVQAGSAGQAAIAPAPSVSAADALKMPVFYLICAVALFINLGMYVYFMVPSYAATLDVGAAIPLLGATASSVAMVGQTVSKLTLGAVGEKHPQSATIVALSCGIAGVALFAFLAELAPAFYAAALLFGGFYGITNVMLPIFTRQSFGDADYPKIYSRVSMVAAIGNAGAAFIWGTLIDVTHSYNPMFVGVVALMAATIVAVVLIERLRRARAGTARSE